MSKKIIIGVVGIFIIFSIISGASNNKNGDVAEGDKTGKPVSNENEVELLVDVNQFSRVTPETLKSIMGEPESEEEWTFNDIYPVTSYFYNDGKYEFMVIDNAVVRTTIHSDKYNDLEADSIEYKSEKAALEMLGIDSSDKRIKKVADTGVALRFTPVSDTVAEVWYCVMNKDAKTIDEIKITYNLNYF